MPKLEEFKTIRTLYEDTDVSVCEAEQKKDCEKVILKILRSERPTNEQIALLRHEFQLNHQLHLKNVVFCRSFIDRPSEHLLVFDSSEGVTLEDYLCGKAVNIDQFFDLALNILDCLEELHESCVIHKDVKPANFLVNPKTLKIKLIDLSHSSQVSTDIREASITQQCEGSLPYIPPEQTGRVNRPVDYRSDFYSLGITFYEMLCGKLPFSSDDPLEYIHFHIAKEAVAPALVNDLIPEFLSKMILKLMNKKPEERYQSITGIREDLKRCDKQWKKEGKIDEFPLGQQDRLDVLTFPSNIYGRDHELEGIMISLEKIKAGGKESLFITGPAGIGKTTLVNEIQEPLTKAKGYFVRGKFEKLEGTTPYTAFKKAFSSLFMQWTGEKESRLAPRKEKIQKALGDQAQVLIDIFPELEWIIGKQPPVEELPPKETQNRFNYLFERLISVLSSKSEPLAIFIDDLQWADQGSVNLLDIILGGIEVESLFLVCSYRDDEINQNKSMVKTIEKLKEEGAGFHEINLQPIAEASLREFMADTLRGVALKELNPLVEVVNSKTGCNPFFFRQFLTELHSRDILRYHYEANRWEWELQKTMQIPGAENVINLIISRADRLPDESRNVLQLAACIGMEFEVGLLSRIRNENELSIATSLSLAARQGMIYEEIKGLRYKFAHDKVLQALYQSNTSQEKESFHYIIGCVLLDHAASLEIDQHVFEILNNFMLGKNLIKENKLKRKIIELCSYGGEKAKKALAYESGKAYLQMAIELLGDSRWNIHDKVIWNINYALVDILFLLAEIEKSKSLIQSLLERVTTDNQKIALLVILMKIYVHLGDHQRNIETCFSALNLYGIHIPSNPGKLYVLYTYLKFRWHFGFKKMKENIQKITLTKEEKTVLYFEIFRMGAPSALFTAPTRVAALGLQAIIYAKKHGASDHIYTVLLGLGIVGYNITNSFADVKIIYGVINEYIKNGVIPKNKLPAIITLYSLYYSHWFDPIENIIAEIEKAALIASETGNVQQSVYCEFSNIRLHLESGYKLDQVIKRIKSYFITVEKFKYYEYNLHVEVAEGMVNYLLFEKPEFKDKFNTSVEQIGLVENKTVKYSDFAYASRLYYLDEDYDKALRYSEVFYSQFSMLKLLTVLPGHLFFRLLILCTVYANSKGWRRFIFLRKIKQVVKHLKKFAEQNPQNFAHYNSFAQAEIARIKNRTLEALSFYDQSIDEASSRGFLPYIALANERAGEFLITLGREKSAVNYLSDAIYYYDNWGCQLKVNRLKKKYGDRLHKYALTHLTKKTVEKDRDTGVFTTEGLDYLSIVKASQAISGQVELPQLLKSMIHIVLENAGADKAFFLGKVDGIWKLEAKDILEHGEENIALPLIPLKKITEGIPHTIVNYVIRTSQTLVLDNPLSSFEYRNDPHIQQTHPKSILCLPVKQYNELIGLLYLENQKIEGAFTEDRISALNTLSSQIAISLENSRYLQHLQMLFQKAERFVPKNFLSLLNKENIEELQLGDSTEKNLAILFCDIRGYTEITERQSPSEAAKFINDYLRHMAPIIRKHQGFINLFLGDAIMALFPNEIEDSFKAGKEILHELQVFNEELLKKGNLPISIGIGIDAGRAMLCTIGEPERMDANIISDAANAASRIENLNKYYGTRLLFSEKILDGISNNNRYGFRLIDKVTLKGKTRVTKLYEYVDWQERLEDMSYEDYLTEFQLGFSFYEKGDFKTALKCFLNLLRHHQDDGVAKVLISRCEQYVRDGKPEDWNGVYNLFFK